MPNRSTGIFSASLFALWAAGAACGGTGGEPAPSPKGTSLKVVRTRAPRAPGTATSRPSPAASSHHVAGGVHSTCSVALSCAPPGNLAPCSEGGSAPASAHLRGTGFDEYEGKAVVGGERVVIAQGGFDLYLGLQSDCALTTTYRIDVDDNGRCDDGVDLVYAVGPGSGTLTVSGSAPGVPSSCGALLGYDLTLTGSCYPGCDAIHVGLFDAAGSQLAANTIDAVPRPTLTFPGRVLPGETYSVRFWFQHIAFDRCNAGTPAWRRSFVAQPGPNTLDITPDDHIDPSACFQ